MTDTAKLRIHIERAQAGDAAGFDQVVHYFQNHAVAYAYVLTQNQHDAEDVAQEAFLAAWQHIRSLRDAAAFSGWLRQIVFKHADRVRRQRRLSVPLDTIGDHADPDDGPDARLLKHEKHTALQTALGALSESERAAMLLYYVGECGQAEVAAFLEISVPAVKKRLERGRTRLRGVLTMSDAGNVWEYLLPSQSARFVEMNRLLRDLTAQLEADPQVTAAYLARWGNDEGWGAQNDAWASLNLHVVVRDAYIDHFAGGRLAYAARIREPLLWVEAPQNAPLGGYYLMTLYDGEAGPYQVDWYFRPGSQSRVLPEQTIVLVNKAARNTDGRALDGGFNGTTPAYSEAVPPALETLQNSLSDAERGRDEQRNRISLFWAMWLISARYIARNPNEERMGFVPMLRNLTRDVRQGLGEAVQGESEDEPQPTPEAKIALLRTLAAEMESLHPQAVAHSVAVPVAVVPRAHRFLNLIAETVEASSK